MMSGAEAHAFLARMRAEEARTLAFYVLTEKKFPDHFVWDDLSEFLMVLAEDAETTSRYHIENDGAAQ